MVEILTRGDRGFHGYGEVMRCAYGTEIEVYESSSAERPHVWLKLQLKGDLLKAAEEGNGMECGESIAHLNEEQARALIDRLQTWLDEIPSRWGQKPEAPELGVLVVRDHEYVATSIASDRVWTDSCGFLYRSTARVCEATKAQHQPAPVSEPAAPPKGEG